MKTVYLLPIVIRQTDQYLKRLVISAFKNYRLDTESEKKQVAHKPETQATELLTIAKKIREAV